MTQSSNIHPNHLYPLGRLGVIGCGIMGGSIALAALEAGLDVVVYDISPGTLRLAEEAGLKTAVTPADACANRDVVVLAAPVDAILSLAPMIKPFLEHGTIVTEIGSVKAPLRGLVESLSSSHVSVVPSHPMTGSELVGFENAAASLLRGCTWLVCPTADNDSAARLSAFVSTIGAARTLSWPLENHDAAVAAVSHLPQLTASLLAAVAGAAEESYARGALIAAGGGFRDTTRVADSSLDVWLPVIDGNRVMLATLLDDLAARASEVAQGLRSGDLSSVERLFKDGHETRDRWRQTLASSSEPNEPHQPPTPTIWRDTESSEEVWLEGSGAWMTVRTTVKDPAIHADLVLKYMAHLLSLDTSEISTVEGPNHVRVASALRAAGVSLAEKETWSADGLSLKGVVIEDVFYIIA